MSELDRVIDSQQFYKEAELNGLPCEGRIAGALRGGYSYQGYFTANGPVGSYHIKRMNEVQDFRYATEYHKIRMGAIQ